MPVIADLQREVADAGDDRTRRRHARRRGYLASGGSSCPVVFTIPPSSEGPLRSLLLGRSGGNLLIAAGIALLSAILPVFGWFAAAVIGAGALVAIGLRRWNDRHTGSRGAVEPLVWIPALALFAAIWPMFGWFVVAVVVSGAVAAIALRRWNTRHPSTLAPADPLAARPDAQINLSSIPVGGDFGGLMFVVGSFVIVLLGFPDARWFVLGSIVIGGRHGRGSVRLAIDSPRSRSAGRLIPGTITSIPNSSTPNAQPLPTPNTQHGVGTWRLGVVGSWALGIMRVHSTGSIFSTIPSALVPPLAPSVAT